MKERDGRWIDAHLHVWQYRPGDQLWIEPGQSIARDYALVDLPKLPGGTLSAVLVQSAESEAETRFLLDTARASAGFVRGVVGWVPMAAADAPQRIAALAADPLLKGLRPMLGFIEDAAWILRADVQPALAAMAQHRLRLDVPARSRHLALLPELARSHPCLAMVIDHAAKPPLGQLGRADDALRDWAAGIARVARETAVFCKLSGLLPAAPTPWRADELRWTLAHLLACFGPHRLMWGSDWPVSELSGGPALTRELLLDALPEDCREPILASTAAAFYGL